MKIARFLRLTAGIGRFSLGVGFVAVGEIVGILMRYQGVPLGHTFSHILNYNRIFCVMLSASQAGI